MSYFEKFPYTTYELSGATHVVKDILRRSKFISEYVDYSDLYTTYTINDGETPQSIAHREYGAATYHWVILMFNEIHNPYFDWPMSQYDLDAYCKNKYTEEFMYMTKHYEVNGNVVGEIKEFDITINWVPPTVIGINQIPISFYDYEVRLNDKKREIRLLRSELLSQFVSEFGESIND